MIKDENNVGKWDSWYESLPTEPGSFRYSDTITYKEAANFLSDCATVEDWGVGGGGFLRYRPDAIGVDGSDTKFATKKHIDLQQYISKCEGVHIRHILEHNYNWFNILENALKSATKKIVITMFIPLNEDITKEVSHNKQHGVDVPDMSISKKEFYDIISKYKNIKIETQNFKTPTGYGEEEMIFLTIL